LARPLSDQPAVALVDSRVLGVGLVDQQADRACRLASRISNASSPLGGKNGSSGRTTPI